MPTPIAVLLASLGSSADTSFGGRLAQHVEQSGNIVTLLDCLCTSSTPAIYSPDISRPPLSHERLHTFVSNFSLPHSHGNNLGPNDRVMLVLETGPENALALIALASYHTCAPVNANCTATELRDDARRLNAKAIVTTQDLEERLRLSDLRKEIGCDVIYIESLSSGPAGLFDMELADSANVARSSLPSRPHCLSDTSLVLHTSGTSGKKKVVPYTLRSLIIGTGAVIHSWGLGTMDVNYNMMPLFHVGGIVRNLLAPVLSGGSTIMCSDCDPITFWTLSTELRATWYYAAPTIHQAILGAQIEAGKRCKDSCIRMICNAAGALLPSLAIELKNAFEDAAILPSYGMTECMPIATPPLAYQLDRPGCSGQACGPQLSIRNPSNAERELPAGMVGAISVRGPPTFDGYEVSPDPDVPLDTSAFSADGWFDSGDMGFIDNDGYLFITGRSKEIINKGGEVISPFEIEEAIITSAKGRITDVLAFSVDHEVLQEAIGVVVVPVPNRPRISLGQLQTLLKDHLPPSKWPFVVVYMSEIPKSSAGKPQRIGLSSRFGITCLMDRTPILHRHFEADMPHTPASPTDPIPCSKVIVDLHEIDRVLAGTPGIKDFALRLNQAASPEAFIYIDWDSGLNPNDIESSISCLLPGYSLPEFHFLSQPLNKSGGNVDFDSLEKEIARQHASDYSEDEILVRDMIANLLLMEPGKIARDSDFFLLGGNSLLLGQLSYRIRKQVGISIGITALFRRSTVDEIALLIEEGRIKSGLISTAKLSYGNKFESSPSVSGTTLRDSENFASRIPSRDQTNPLVMIVQALPFLFFYPLKSALSWAMLLFVLSYLAPFVNNSHSDRLGALLLAILTARVSVGMACPLTAIAFKWIFIGRYRTGTYRMWSTYYLRWWIVDQSIRLAGKGIFAVHPCLELTYYRMLGAHIGKDVHIDETADLAEFDLLTFEDGCRIDRSHVRGFCVERDGFFRLDKVTIGRNAVINTYTVISPGAIIADSTVYGPHSSSHEDPSPPQYAAYNRTLIREPHWLLQLFVAWPVMAIVYCISYLPWAAVILLMLDQKILVSHRFNALEGVVWWFASPERLCYHVLSRAVRATLTPVLQIALGIVVKRAFGLNVESSAADDTQLPMLRRYINSVLLSQEALERAFRILGHHYQVVAIVFRAMGAKVGKRVYWPGSGFYCLDPEMLDIGDDVIFGSRSELITSDGFGTGKIRIKNGAMVADRVVLLPDTCVGTRTVMGSGSLGKRNTTYADGETWIGNDHGEAICLQRASKDMDVDSPTITPFGNAFYLRKANYFVLPYFLLLMINITIEVLSAVYWSTNAVVAAQFLHQLQRHLRRFDLFGPRWYRFGILYGFIASCFVVVLGIQAILSMLWVVLTKWVLLGRRRPGRYEWDQSSYCQRWKLHVSLSRIISCGRGPGGVLAPLTGSVYLVWYLRALGAKIGKNCAIYAGGGVGLMTEPDLVELRDDVNLDDCSVVAHINSRGNFALNHLIIGNGCAMRSGSRLLSGASMEDGSVLFEHSLLTSGEVAEAGATYAGWPACRLADCPADTTRAYQSSLKGESGPATPSCSVANIRNTLLYPPHAG